MRVLGISRVSNMLHSYWILWDVLLDERFAIFICHLEQAHLLQTPHLHLQIINLHFFPHLLGRWLLGWHRLLNFSGVISFFLAQCDIYRRRERECHRILTVNTMSDRWWVLLTCTMCKVFWRFLPMTVTEEETQSIHGIVGKHTGSTTFSLWVCLMSKGTKTKRQECWEFDPRTNIDPLGWCFR